MAFAWPLQLSQQKITTVTSVLQNDTYKVCRKLLSLNTLVQIEKHVCKTECCKVQALNTLFLRHPNISSCHFCLGMH